MQFAGPMHRGVYEMVHGWLEDLIRKEAALAPDKGPVFYVRQGSAFAQVGIYSTEDRQEAIIEISCMVAKVEKIDTNLLAYLLNANLKTQFCAIGVDFESNAIAARAALLGSTCDPKEFFAVLGRVVSTADQLDDEIVKNYGGQTSLEHFRQAMEAAQKSGAAAPQ